MHDQCGSWVSSTPRDERGAPGMTTWCVQSDMGAHGMDARELSSTSSGLFC